MREIHFKEIVAAIRNLCIEANIEIPSDTLAALRRSQAIEESEIGKDVLNQLIRNADAARRQRLPICQDTGYAVLYVELGQDVHIAGGSFAAAIDAGVRQGYAEGFLRKSMVQNPLARINTGDNTPAVVVNDLYGGDLYEDGRRQFQIFRQE